ncbi:MAG: AsmA family protein [Magnetospirillum sp.]|nr:AsmA family protein [Magnetospirillum sp.]
MEASRLRAHKPALLAATLAVGLLVLALGIPALLDGNSWRLRIEAEASAALGRKVTIAGPIKARLLPAPAIGLAALSVEGAGSAERISLGLRLMPLLGGRLELAEIGIDGGRVGRMDRLAARITVTGERLDGRGSAHLAGQPASFEVTGQIPPPGGDAPVKAVLRLPGPDATAAFEGKAGKDHLEGKLDLSLASASRTTGLAGLPDAPLGAQANLTLSREELVLADMGILLGESTITGSLVASLTGAPALMDITLRADSFDLDARPATAGPAAAAPKTIPTTAASPPASVISAAPAAAAPFELPSGLAANLDLGITRLLWRGEAIRNIQINALLEGGRITLSQASAKLPGSGSIKLSGAFTTPEGRPRFDGEVKAESQSLPALRAWLGLGGADNPRKGRLESKLVLAESKLALKGLVLILDEWRITGIVAAGLTNPATLSADLASQGLAAGFDGIVQDGMVDGQASLRAASFAQAARLLSPGYHPQGGGELAVVTRLTAASGAIAFSDLQARAGDAVVTGQGSLSLGGQPKLTATLAGNAIALDPFLPAERKAELAPRRFGRAAPPPPPIIPAALTAESPWSKTPFDFSWLRALDADITLGAKSLSQGNWRLDDAKAHFALAKGIADLDRLGGRVMGGDLAAAGRLAPNGMTLSATLKGADLAQARLAAGGIALTKGRFSAEARLAAAGTSPAALAASLAGNGRLEASDGEVRGFDLAAMDAQMRRLENLGSLFGLVQAGLSGGTSRFSSLTGSFTADHGIVASRDLALVADGGGATGIATIDLPKETISSKFAFKLATPDAPALGLRLEGKLSSPNKAVDVNDLQRYLVEKGLGKALKSQAGAPDDRDAPKKFKAGDALRGLFSTFGKKKAE